ncbi:type II toxin-antitoxin system HipA family toxin [Mariprofundus sp. NF]|uniref:type II toxin-antitoxin system HipA family toxin n=1 Tax=Mariprofundus sp. NF TaxID=2608716 RepID=UPI0015A1B242|nr:type II toxin-antitoxin system HipA family toxin [Mariprofundus sp. NF]NWF38889.1 type II toxin-antitoxin system HipA family toxin [Mariprofundus sp. NF]
MSSIAEVKLWGRTIGAVSLNDGDEIASFEYDPGFARSGIEISPLTMPLSNRIYQFPALSRQTFHGLPGLLADSLPDKFGNALIDVWLATQGREATSFNAVERLCYTGARGMGALEFAPAIGVRASRSHRVELENLVALASDILTHRNNLQTSFTDETKALTDILQVGTSAGGARAKAVIAWNPISNEVRSGQVAADKGFEYWLLKFDGVSGNRDKELDDPQGYGVIEYAYYMMAKACNIDISESRLFEENSRRHFMTKRFDRLDGGEKLHMQSLGALAHFDFNMAGAYSYEQALQTMRKLNLPMHMIEEQFRRMVFNIVARNQDDHVKNIAFLMNKSGQWRLSPAFDITYSYNPAGNWTAKHQMSVNGKRDAFTMDDFKACAKVASMKRGRAETIVKEVQGIVSQWKTYAHEAGVPEHTQQQIQQMLRLSPF